MGTVTRLIRKGRKIAGRRYRYSRFGKVASRTLNSLNPFKMAQRSLYRFPKDILPSRRFATLTYHEMFTMYLTVTNDAEGFLANGLYDPYVPAGGHQPRGFDQYMAMYKRFTVLRSRMRVCIGGVPTAPLILAVRHGRELLGTGATPNAMLESDGTTWKIVRVGDEHTTVYSNFDAKRDVGIDVMHETDWSGTVGADPTEKYYFEVMIITADGTSPNTTDAYHCDIEYDCVFWEPNRLAPS